MRALALASCLALAALSTACAFGDIYWRDPLTREYTLREAQHRYTALVRWSEFAKALEFVADDAKDAFLAAAPDFDDLRFTDYEVKGTVDLDELGESTVTVTYTGYSPRSPLEIQVKEVQHWKRIGSGNEWRVAPRFEGLDTLHQTLGSR
jgi:hypothetical protein